MIIEKKGMSSLTREERKLQELEKLFARQEQRERKKVMKKAIADQKRQVMSNKVHKLCYPHLT